MASNAHVIAYVRLLRFRAYLPMLAYYHLLLIIGVAYFVCYVHFLCFACPPPLRYLICVLTVFVYMLCITLLYSHGSVVISTSEHDFITIYICRYTNKGYYCIIIIGSRIAASNTLYFEVEFETIKRL